MNVNLLGENLQEFHITRSTARCCSTDHWCSPKSVYHRDSAWHVTLVASTSAHSVQSRRVLGQGPGYFDDVLVPVHTVGARARLRSADHRDMVVPSPRVRAQFVSVSAASAHLHHQCGTTFRLNWRTATLVDRVLNLALSHGFLSVPTR